MAKLSASTLKKLIEELDTYGISKTKANCIRELAEAELTRREGVDRFQEFHKWIRQGDQILTEMEAQMQLLKEATSEDADLISKIAVLEILNAMYIKAPSNDHEKGQTWTAEQALKKINALPAVKKTPGT